MNERTIIFGTVLIGCALIVLYIHRSKSRKYTGNGAVTSNVKSNDNPYMYSWWDSHPKNTYLDAVRQSMSSTANKIFNRKNFIGKGPSDTLVSDASNSVITQDDIVNYVTEYDKITDQGVTTEIDPADTYSITNNFNDPTNDQNVDNVQYNLFANPDENNYEVLTSKQLYEKSESPSIVDLPFQFQEVTYYLDDDSSTTYATPRDSINSSENIDPSLTDGVVYFPDNNDINNQNLFDIMRETINDRASNTQSVFLENSMLDDSVFVAR